MLPIAVWISCLKFECTPKSHVEMGVLVRIRGSNTSDPEYRDSIKANRFEGGDKLMIFMVDVVGIDAFYKLL